MEYKSDPELLQAIGNHLSGFVAKHERQFDPENPRRWQPADFYMDPIGDHDKILRYRKELVPSIPLELRIALAGDILTEEGLPGYMYTVMRFAGMLEDPSLRDWARRWVAEEKRHGKVLSHWAYVSGAFDMRVLDEVEENYNIQEIDLQIPPAQAGSFLMDVASSFIYVSFQEDATRISHLNAAKNLQALGDDWGHDLHMRVAADEAKHHAIYRATFAEILAMSPSYSILALKEMVRKGFVMPSMNSLSPQQYDQFEYSAAKAGIFGACDYFEVVSNLISKWKIASIPGLQGELAQAQDYLGKWGDKVGKMPKIFERGQKKLLARNMDLSGHPWLRKG